MIIVHRPSGEPMVFPSDGAYVNGAGCLIVGDSLYGVMAAFAPGSWALFLNSSIEPIQDGEAADEPDGETIN